MLPETFADNDVPSWHRQDRLPERNPETVLRVALAGSGIEFDLFGRLGICVELPEQEQDEHSYAKANQRPATFSLMVVSNACSFAAMLTSRHLSLPLRLT